MATTAYMAPDGALATRPETRRDVCDWCEHNECQGTVYPQCDLIVHPKARKPAPCVLRKMLQRRGAKCPHPDPEWAARWDAAELEPPDMHVQAQATRPAVSRRRRGMATIGALTLPVR